MNATQLHSADYWGDIPQDWQFIPIKYGFNLIGSGTTPPTGQQEYFGGSIPWVTTSELRENFITFTTQTVSELAIAEFSALKIFSENTVLIAMYGATIGRVAILGIPACVNQAVCALAQPIWFEPRYVSYTLQASRDYLLSLASGGGQPNLNAEKIKGHYIPCPPLSEQRAIANYLDSEIAKIDTLISARERLLDLLTEKRRALITHAVTRGLNPDVSLQNSSFEFFKYIPEHWEVINLKFLTEVRTGVTKGRNFGNRETVLVPYFRVANVQDGYLDLSDIAQIEVLPEEISSFKLEKGDVLMNEGGDADKLGRGAVWDGSIDPCLHQNHVFAVRCHNIEPDWLTTVIGSHYAKAYFESRSKQSTNLASISTTNIKELPIVVPPPEERKAIIEYLKEATSKLDRLCSVATSTIELLHERRTALITAAVTGQISVTL